MRVYLHLPYESISSVLVPPAAYGESDSKMRITDDHFKLGSTVGAIRETSVGLRKSAYAERASSSGSDGASDSDTDSVSTTDSEIEREREEKRRRREQILAQKAATKAVETIKERENKVARLEGEKQSLEKILQDRAKQQAQEASELQTTMMETMEAVDLEKQKHNNTRMEALARIAKLEVYVHSKLMIIHDRAALIGSSNINDRSLLGSRDSEIGVLIEDEDWVESSMNGEPWRAGKFAYSLRISLWLEHLGLNPSEINLIQDPVIDTTYRDLWFATAKKNTKIYHDVFSSFQMTVYIPDLH